MKPWIVTDRSDRARRVLRLGRGLAILPLLGTTIGCTPDQEVRRDQSTATGGNVAVGGSSAAQSSHAGGSTLGGTSSKAPELGGQGGGTATLSTNSGGTAVGTGGAGTPVSETGGAPNKGGATSTTSSVIGKSGGATSSGGKTSTTSSAATTGGSASTASSSGGANTAGSKSTGKAGSGNSGGSVVGGTSSTGTVSALGGGTGVTVQLDGTHQTIQGFGINDTWASEAVPSSLFSTTGDGIGLTIMRIGMSDQGSDYSSTMSTDATMAKNAGGKVIGSVWSPPASCKTNSNVNDGGHFKETCYESWSDTIVKWAKSHSLYAMSIGNEPDFASCGRTDPCNGNYPTTLFTAKEYVAWVKVAGPKLQAAGIKVIGPEASEWIHNWSNISAGPDVAGKNSSDPLKCGCFGMTIDAATEAKCSSTCASGDGYDYGHWLAKDADAWKAFDIMGVHEYDTQIAYAWPSDITVAKKEVWQTEMSGVKWWPEQGPSSDIKNGVAVAGWIHSALVVGDVNAWLWWWYKAYDTDDNEGLLLAKGTDTKRHYTLGNYSKFVRPGYVRVDVNGNSNPDLLLSAYKSDKDSTVVVVAINKGSASATVPISIAGGTAPASMTPNVTSASDNLKAATAVTVTGGSFTATLASMTVTTFVGK